MIEKIEYAGIEACEGGYIPKDDKGRIIERRILEKFWSSFNKSDGKRLLTCYTSNYDIETLEKIAQYHHLRAAINRIRGHAVQLIVNGGCLRK